MPAPLLISLRQGETNWTFSVDGTAQSMVWLGFGESVDADNAIAVVVSTESDTVLQPTRDYHLVDTQGNEHPRVVLGGATGTLLYVMGPGIEGRVTLHSRSVTEGMKQYRKLVFTRDAQFTIGRAAKNNIVYANPFVSGEHVQMVYQANSGTFYVKDMESGNGTLLNGKYLPGLQPYELKVGDILQILDLTIVAGRGFISHSCPESFPPRATSPTRSCATSLRVEGMRRRTLRCSTRPRACRVRSASMSCRWMTPLQRRRTSRNRHSWRWVRRCSWACRPSSRQPTPSARQ